MSSYHEPHVRPVYVSAKNSLQRAADIKCNFLGVFNKTIILHMFLGYEIVIENYCSICYMLAINC